LASQIYDTHQNVGAASPSRLVSEEVSDFIQRQGNYFVELEDAATKLHEEAGLRHPDLFGGLVEHLQRRHGVTVSTVPVDREDNTLRRFDPATRELRLTEIMSASSRVFQTAAQIALLEHPELLARLAEGSDLRSDASRKLARVVLANYFAGAVMMPYEPMLEAARAQRYDIELLGHRFGASFEQVCQRLTSLQRPEAEGIPLHMIRVDLAGNISKRFSGSGIRFARFAGACPRWNVFSAFLAPGTIRIQISTMPDGEAYFCVARTVPKGHGGFATPHTVQAIGLGCPIRYAKQMVYSDGMDAESLETAIPVGVTCRLCERRRCEQRAFPSIRSDLELDENVRGPSFFASPDTVD
jgi:predicted transcriptional regulator